jgi:NAD(P)-dependent dehydrogenase (short-subunit alcohol dehydrogenase family)
LLSLTGHGEIDLEDLDVLPFELEKLLAGVDDLNLLVLNAGKLGPMAYLEDQTQTDLESLMKVNVWSNKVLVDWCLKNMPSLEQVVMVSSGASLNGNAGWGGYSISKAALNMLVKLYASEVNEVHFCSLAPGLIDTPMQDYLCGLEDQGDFPSLQRLRLARGTQEMPSPEQAGQVIWKALPSLKKFPSGSYQDIRKL